MGERTVRRRVVAVVLVAGGLAAAAVWLGWRVAGGGYDALRLAGGAPEAVTVDAETEARIVAFCSDCHALPRPESFPRNAWDDEAAKGYEYYARSGRNDLDPPPMGATKSFYRSRAPERIEFSAPVEADHKLGAAFTTEFFSLGPELNVPPGISHLRWARLEADADPVLLACDMRNGEITAVKLAPRHSPPQRLARLNNPARIEPCDLDQDGAIDLVVADLGSSFPYDHAHGRVVWLRRQGEGRSFEPVVIAEGMGRVADARPADVDGDGDLDLLVAEFGHYRTGGIWLLTNAARSGETPRFETKRLDTRPGTIHVPLADFDGDGRLDFLALVSQEYECVDLFLQRVGEPFHRRTLWAGPDLTFGSSGIEPVDLDQDGDLDILYTNGDAFDNSYVNRAHGVQWLENLGGERFAYHRLTDMLGAYRALPGDIDGDGDLDIIVVAWLPPQLRPWNVNLESLGSIICLEQTSPGRFARHTLRRGVSNYATLELSDFDGDGDTDFAVGMNVLTVRMTNVRNVPRGVTVWWSQQVTSGE